MTLTMDLQYSNWAELDKLFAEYDTWGEGEFVLNWEDAIQIRVGLEHKITDCLTYRLGYYYDPAPAPDATLNILFPSSTNHAFTGGISHSWGNIQLEAAAEYLLGAERSLPYSANYAMPGDHKLDVFAFSLGLGYNL